MCMEMHLRGVGTFKVNLSFLFFHFSFSAAKIEAFGKVGTGNRGKWQRFFLRFFARRTCSFSCSAINLCKTEIVKREPRAPKIRPLSLSWAGSNKIVTRFLVRAIIVLVFFTSPRSSFVHKMWKRVSAIIRGANLLIRALCSHHLSTSHGEIAVCFAKAGDYKGIF